MLYRKDGYAGGAGLVYSQGSPTLMTLCHCPIQVSLGGNCTNCRFSNNLVYEDERNNRYRIRRTKLDSCYFGLYSEEKYERKSINGKIVDLRKV